MTAVPPVFDDATWRPLAVAIHRAIPHPRRVTTHELMVLSRVSKQRFSQALAYAEGRTVAWCRHSGTWGRLGEVTDAPVKAARTIVYPGQERDRKRRAAKRLLRDAARTQS